MLIRIVRMSFKPENTEKFLTLYNQKEEHIRKFEGCLHLELLNDYHQENVYFTYSHWTNDKALEKYRRSDLFQEVWQNTKVLFLEKPVAYSLLKNNG